MVFSIFILGYLCNIGPMGHDWRLSGRPFAAVNLSCMGHSIHCVMKIFICNWFHMVPAMFDPAQLFRAHLGCLAGPLQQTICLAGAIVYSAGCIYSLKIGFRWYLQCLIKRIFGPLFEAHSGHMQQGVSGRHPYLHTVNHTMDAGVVKYWYLVRLIKMLWAAGL